jgi:uncharacterized protein with FMN-binding domain
MRRIALAIALFALLVPASTSAAVRPQQGMAGVSLGMSKAQVRAKLGGPIGSGGGRFYYARVWVGFRLGRVVEVTTTHTNDRTRSGVGVDSTEAAVKRAYPSVVCAPAGGFRRCRLGSGKPGTRATDFLIGHGRVLQLTVQLLPG